MIKRFLDIAFLVVVSMVSSVLIAVMFNEYVEDWAKEVLGVGRKREAIELISLGIAGIVTIWGTIWGTVTFIRRVGAQDKSADAQVRVADAQVENNKLVEKGHAHEHFKTAVGHLGSEHVAARIASFHEFYRLARDNEDLRRHIFDILCAHLRQTTADKKYKEKVEFTDGEKNHEVKPTEEVQSLLDVLFHPKDSQDEWIFAGYQPNLRGVFLVGARLRKVDLREADLWDAHLDGADLQDADLRKAELHYAILREVKLQGADLRGAILQYVRLQGAKLLRADLQEADLRYANLEGADLLGVNLRHAVLWYADLRKVDLEGADLRDTDLLKVDLRGAKLWKTDLEGADLEGADLRTVDLRRVKKLGTTRLKRANLHSADLRFADLQEVRNLETANLGKAKIQWTRFPDGYKPPADADTTGDELVLYR